MKVVMISSVLFSLISTPVLMSDDSDFCKEQNCKEPNYTVPVTQYEIVVGASPLYVTVLPLTNKTKNIDNVCYSFFQLEKTRLVLYISTVFKDNTYEIFSYVKDDIPGRLGTLRGGDPTCTFQEFAVSAQCDLTLILYRCFIIGACNGFDAVFDPNCDVFFGLSALPCQRDACKDEHIAFIKSQPEFNTGDYVKLPQKLPYKCVTGLPFNGRAINELKLQDQAKVCVQYNCSTGPASVAQLQEQFDALQAIEKAYYSSA